MFFVVAETFQDAVRIVESKNQTPRTIKHVNKYENVHVIFDGKELYQYACNNCDKTAYEFLPLNYVSGFKGTRKKDAKPSMLEATEKWYYNHFDDLV
jgi:hypothetical protein